MGVVVSVLGVALFMASGVCAQVKQEVPNNPLEPAGPVQPIPFSHKTHMAAGLQCQLCHTNPGSGVMMGLPNTATCMKCHATIARNTASIKKLARYARSKTPVPWVRVYKLLPGVTWSHRKHLEAGIHCQACHGQVSQMNLMAETTSAVTMYSCVNCHAEHKVPTTCVTCHRYMQVPHVPARPAPRG